MTFSSHNDSPEIKAWLREAYPAASPEAAPMASAAAAPAAFAPVAPMAPVAPVAPAAPALLLSLTLLHSDGRSFRLHRCSFPRICNLVLMTDGKGLGAMSHE